MLYIKEEKILNLNHNKNNIIKYLLIAMAFSTFAQILLGASVRLTHSGLSCPDWPLCYGMFFPTISKFNELNVINFTYFQVMLEWIHRFNAAFFIGPITIMVFVFIYLKNKSNKVLLKSSFILLLLLLTQGLLGGLTVFQANSPWSVAVHLSCAFLFFGLILFMICNFINQNKAKETFLLLPKNKIIYIFTAGIVTLITSVAGAFTSKYGASLACTSWPLCNENFFSEADSFELIHFSHRVLGMILFISLALMVIKVHPHINQMKQKLKNILQVMVIVFVLQVFIGAMLITYSVPIWMGILHQSIGLTLFGLIVVLISNTKILQSN